MLATQCALLVTTTQRRQLRYALAATPSAQPVVALQPHVLHVLLLAHTSPSSLALAAWLPLHAPLAVTPRSLLTYVLPAIRHVLHASIL